MIPPEHFCLYLVVYAVKEIQKEIQKEINEKIIALAPIDTENLQTRYQVHSDSCHNGKNTQLLSISSGFS